MDYTDFELCSIPGKALRQIRCMRCGAMVGAAADEFILQLLQEAHQCDLAETA